MILKNESCGKAAMFIATTSGEGRESQFSLEDSYWYAAHATVDDPILMCIGQHQFDSVGPKIIIKEITIKSKLEGMKLGRRCFGGRMWRD